MALALAILMLVSSCLASNVLKHEDTTIVHNRRLLDDGKAAANAEYYHPQSSVNNHHYIPREDFKNYLGGVGDGSE